MTGHDIDRMESVREYEHVAVCECGHQSHGPNLLTAEKRHAIHQSISDARRALEEGSSGGA